MKLYSIILGLILLVAGRKLFWLFVAIAGFLVGMEFADLIMAHQPQWLRLLVALGAGGLGAFLAMVAQRVAFAIAGFYGGAYLALMLAQAIGDGGNPMLFFVAGGVVGAVCAILAMDAAIIVLSCLIGAAAIVDALPLGPGTGVLVFALLAGSGAFIQTRFQPRPRER